MTEPDGSTVIRWVRCGGGSCVEVGMETSGHIAVRHSKDPGSILRFSTSEWEAFLAGVGDGEFTVAKLAE